MNTVPNPRSLSSSRIGLALVAFAVVSCSAEEARGPETVASLMKSLPAMSTESRDSSACASAQRPANSIRLEGAHGEALELAYFAGCGWKYIAANRNAVREAGLAKMAYDPASAPQRAALATPEDPMTVFIDGPTGYTFVWTPASGWKFVGHVQR